jgi:hypothetical protein
MTSFLIAVCLASCTGVPDGNYVRRTPDAKTLIVFDYVGVGIVNDSGESINLQAITHNYYYDRKCTGSSGNPDPEDWTMYFASLFETPDTNIEVVWGGVSVPSGYGYTRRIRCARIAQYDVYYDQGEATIMNLVIPAVERWEYETSPGGNINPDLTLSRTTDDNVTITPEHHIFEIPGGGGPY